jgi:tryptophanyl-tRNA synthetase
VPVGEDQRQHLELMRDLAERFNTRFGNTFPIPEASIPKTAARVRDLQDPAKRMSTTQSSEEGKILMLDPPDVILRKFKRAVTDSGSEIVAREDKPGVSNLLDVLSAVTGSDLATLEAGYVGKGYGALKVDVAEAVIEGLRPIQERYAVLASDRAELARLLDRGAERARELARPVLAEVRERVGLVGSVS